MVILEKKNVIAPSQQKFLFLVGKKKSMGYQGVNYKLVLGLEK